MAAADEFTEFAAGAVPRLRRTAFLLCGNWHTAEDLTQTTLAKMFVAWRRIKRQEAVYAYANRALVNTYLADRRGKGARELLAGWLPERSVESPAPELRMVILDALATLPPKARVVVIMRYWADLSVDQVADLLGCSPGNVKSQSARGLAKLRVVLGESVGSGPLADRLVEQPTPNGRTVYVVTLLKNQVIPISTATNTAGKPIRVGKQPVAIAITPDGRTAYVANMASGTVTPITTATNTPGPAISVGLADPRATSLTGIVITPDGRTVYVLDSNPPYSVVPISTATDRAGKPISVGPGARAIAITPDGKTAYVLSASTVTPIDVATNKAGPPVKIGEPGGIVFTPDSKTAYVDSAVAGTVTPISVATNTAGTPIKTGRRTGFAIAITPDGKTIFVGNFDGAIMPVSTATNTAGTPIRVCAGLVQQIAITPDGKAAYVTCFSSDVTPVSLATDQAGAPIKVPSRVLTLVIVGDAARS